MSQRKSKVKGVAGGETQHFLKAILNEDPPPNFPAGKSSKPDVTFVPEHVYGYGGDRNKSCLQFGKDSSEIVFFSAALGIVQDLNTHTQKFFGALEKVKGQPKYEANWGCHQDDITDLSVAHTKERNIVATGECGAKSTVHIWDTNDLKSIA